MTGKQTVGEALKLANKRVLVKDAVALIGDLRKTCKSPKRVVKRAAVSGKKAALLNQVKTIVTIRKMAKEAHVAAKKELTRVAVRFTMAKHSNDANFKKKAAVELARVLTCEKAANIMSVLGEGMLRGGGRATRGLGALLNRIGLGQAGKMVGGAGSKLRQLGGLATAANKMGTGFGASANLASRLSKASPEVLERLAAKTPEMQRAQGIAELLGLGGTAAGTYGLGSMLLGGGKSEQDEPELALPPHYAEEYPQ